MRYRQCLRIALVTIALAGYAFTKGCSVDKKGYEDIALDQFVELMDNKDFILINVHIPYQGEIPGTDVLIPFNEIDQHKAELPINKDTKIVVYCMTGPMGDQAAKQLVRMGYSQVIHFKDGMVGWKTAGKQLRFRSQ